GPVGVFTALILARNGIKIILMEERNEVFDTAPRAMAFQPCALAEMVEAGVYEDVYRDSVKEAVISWWNTVRAESGIPFEGFTWPKEEFVATNIYYPFDKYGFTNRNFMIDSTNWAIVAKISNDGLWRVAYGVKPGMTKNQIMAELPERFKNFLPGPGEGYSVKQANSYRPHQRCAARFRKGRMILVGDAAHLNNPIGGLGLTTGILDAGPLARALIAVISGKAPDSLLDKWDELCRNCWHEHTNKQSIEFKRI
ncbi:hypothetical protein NA56DRAFT_555559, partial [Hyaloscypha hepaticicola]